MSKQANIKDDNQVEEVTPQTVPDDTGLQVQLDEKNQEIEALKNQISELQNQWKRALADYQNLVKRTDADKRDFVQFAVKGFLEKILPVIDDLELAQKHLKDEGLGLAIKKAVGVLENSGVVRIDTHDKQYDIHTMEAISIVEGEKDNVVMDEHRAGYLMHGSVLRPAQVTVSKKTLNSKS